MVWPLSSNDVLDVDKLHDALAMLYKWRQEAIWRANKADGVVQLTWTTEVLGQEQGGFELC